MEPNTNYFTQHLPEIESIPFTDVEACNILNITMACLCRATKQGLIQKSVIIDYRFDISFNFISLLDIYEYALRANLFFLNYGANAEASELVYRLIDELAFIIDACYSSNSSRQLHCIQKDLEAFCKDDHEDWEKYWLIDGDPFSAKKCSIIALKCWCNIFDKSMGLINPQTSV